MIFKLFSNCIITNGIKNAVVSDLQRGRVQFIPKELGTLMNKRKNIKYPNDDKVVHEYLDYLIEKEYGFTIDDVENEFFPDISLNFEFPKIITNAIIDFGKECHPVNEIFDQLDEINPSWIVLRFFEIYSIDDLTRIFNRLENLSNPISVICYIRYSEDIESFCLTSIRNKYFNIAQLVFHSCPYDKESENIQGVHVSYLSNELDSHLSCGVINKNLFAVNLVSFSESKTYNSCLNMKISISTEGNIKNCPSMSQSFGNIKDTSLQEALDHPEFKKYWNITKDKIHVCKDCEFRYICTDCRAYVEDPEDILSKPLKCGYNPYKGEWSEWSTNPLKQKAITHYGMEELVKKE